MVDIHSTLKISLRALRVNKMRSALTMLGIIIGVGAVIAMVAVGTGAGRRISEQISSIGSNLIIILPGATTAGGVRMGAGTQPTLSMGDVEAILKESSAVSDAAPVLSGIAQVVYGNQNWSTGIVGTTPDMLDVRDWRLSAGRSFTEQDVKSSTKVCLLGQTVMDNLFGGIDPIGKIVRMAVGAKTWDLRLQFIIEAVTLSLISGIIGIILGITSSKIISTMAGWPTIVSPISILLAFGFSGLVGIFFGFYPAYKASLLNLIEALRYE